MAITGEQYDTMVKLMRGSPQSAGNRAARRVLVDGVTQAEAMRETGATRSTVGDAVARYREAHRDICEAFKVRSD